VPRSFDGLGQVGDARHRHDLGGTRGHSPYCGRDSRGPTSANDDPVGAGDGGAPKQRSEVVCVHYAIQENDQRRPPGKKPVERLVSVSLGDRNEALVIDLRGNAIELRSGHRLDGDRGALCASPDLGDNRRRRDAIADKNALDGAVSSKQLEDRAASRHDIAPGAGDPARRPFMHRRGGRYVA
jgi:hypothetical protein